MNKKIEISLRPEEAFDEARFIPSLYEKLKLNPQEVHILPVRWSNGDFLFQKLS